ncbi:MAG: menaquinone biosynthesis protein [Candidatus Gastranaerophilales bacterium]|nr:menaquinone biosynthesis protein [Candidatus Gastranaerophilales bacterium]
MRQKDINLGLINFTNCLPVNYSLNKWYLEGLTLYDGCPTEINKMMIDAKIDIAPISSIEYLNNQDKYTLMDNICISSIGKVDSVILFSNYEMNELSGKNIAVPYTSASSIALLKVLLSENGINIDSIKFSTHTYEESLEKFLDGTYDAVLYIGDPALCCNILYRNKYLIYDLGEYWYKMTNLPMVFGTWVARSEWIMSNNTDFIWIKSVLDKAVESGLNMYFNEIISSASNNLKIDKIFIEDYLTNKISYKFTEDHRESLKLFKKLNDCLIKRAEIV